MSARPSTVKSSPGPRRPSLHLVRRKRTRVIKRGRSTRFAPVAVVGAILIAGVIFGVLLEQVVLAQSAFKLTQISKHVDAAQSKHEELLLNAAKLEAPGRIEHYARTKLGMVDPPVVEYIVANVPRHMNRRLASATASGELPGTAGAAAAAGTAAGDAP